MPMYEYVCEDCEKKYEFLVRSAGEKPVCPVCGSKKMKRAFSTFSAHSRAEKSPACPSAGRCSNRSCPAQRL